MRVMSSGADELGSDFDHYSHLFFLQSNCTANSKLSFPIQAGRGNFTKGEILYSYRHSCYLDKSNDQLNT